MSPYIIPGLEKVKPFKPAYLLLLVCNFFNVPVNLVTSKSRRRIYTNPRFVAMYLMRTNLKMSLTEIGLIFGRDHSSVIHAVEKVKGFLQVDEKYLQVVTAVSNYLKLHQRRVNMFKSISTPIREGR